MHLTAAKTTFIRTRQFRFSFQATPVAALHNGTTNSGLCVASSGVWGGGGWRGGGYPGPCRAFGRLPGLPAGARSLRPGQLVCGCDAAQEQKPRTLEPIHASRLWSVRADAGRVCFFLNGRQTRRPGFAFRVFYGIVMVKCIFLMPCIAGETAPGAPDGVCVSSRVWTLAGFLLMIFFFFFCRYLTGVKFRGRSAKR